MSNDRFGGHFAGIAEGISTALVKRRRWFDSNYQHHIGLCKNAWYTFATNERYIMTIILAENLPDGEFNDPIPVKAGLYMLAARHSGTPDPRLAIFVNVGPALDVPLFADDESYRFAKTINLPDCSIYVSNDQTGSGTLNVAIARMGDVQGVAPAAVADLGGPIG